MGQRLTKVKSTKKGLIGITESGEEVPLSAPTPKLLDTMKNPGSAEQMLQSEFGFKHCYEDGKGLLTEEEKRKSYDPVLILHRATIRHMIAEADDNTYFQLGEEEYCLSRVILSYNIFNSKKPDRKKSSE